MGHREAPAEVAGGGGIGNALGAEGVEVVDVVTPPLEVLQAVAVTQGVEGDVEDVIGLGIRQADLEDGEARVDGLDQADIMGESMEEGDAAVAEAVDTVGYLVAEVAAGQDGSRLARELGLVESALDSALAGVELLAYLGVHSKSPSGSGCSETVIYEYPRKSLEISSFSFILNKSGNRLRLIKDY